MRPVTVQNLDGQDQNEQDMDGFKFPSEVTVMRRQTAQSSAVESETTEVMRIDNESSVQDLESVRRISEAPGEDDVSDQPVQVFDDGTTNRSSEVVRVDQESEVTEESEVIRRSTFKGDDDVGTSALAESGK